MKTLLYLISRIKYLCVAVKGQNNRLIKHHYVFCNVTTIISNLPLHLQKQLYRFFNCKAIATGGNNVKGVF